MVEVLIFALRRENEQREGEPWPWQVKKLEKEGRREKEISETKNPRSLCVAAFDQLMSDYVQVLVSKRLTRHRNL